MREGWGCRNSWKLNAFAAVVCGIIAVVSATAWHSPWGAVGCGLLAIVNAVLAVYGFKARSLQ